jgi:hypothetical protein
MKALVCLVTLMTALVPATAFGQAPAQDKTPFGIGGIRLASFSPQQAFSESAEGKPESPALQHFKRSGRARSKSETRAYKRRNRRCSGVSPC